MSKDDPRNPTGAFAMWILAALLLSCVARFGWELGGRIISWLF